MGQGITPIFDTEVERVKEQLAQADALRKQGFANNTGGGYQGGKVFMVGSPLGNIAQGLAGIYMGEKARTRQGELEQQQQTAREDWLGQMPSATVEKTGTIFNNGAPIEAPQATPAGDLTTGVTSPDFLKQNFTSIGQPPLGDQPATFNGYDPVGSSIAAAPREQVTVQAPVSPLQHAREMQAWAMKAPRGMEGVQNFALQQALTAPQREAEALQKREDRLHELKLKAMDLRATQAERLAAQKEIAMMQIEGRKETARLVASLKASGKAGDGEVNQDAADLIAARFIESGDTGTLAGISRNKALHSAVMTSVARQAAEQGIDAKELVQRGLEYGADKAYNRTVGNILGNVTSAANEANQMIPIASDLSKKVSRTDFPTMNVMGNIVKKQTGDPNVVAFDQSIDSLINGYARAINPKGVATVADKKRAHERLNIAFSNGQFEAVTQVMQREMEAALKAPVEARKTGRETRMGTGEAKPDQNADARAWLAANPNDPRAAAVRAKLEGK